MGSRQRPPSFIWLSTIKIPLKDRNKALDREQKTGRCLRVKTPIFKRTAAEQSKMSPIGLRRPSPKSWRVLTRASKPLNKIDWISTRLWSWFKFLWLLSETLPGSAEHHNLCSGCSTDSEFPLQSAVLSSCRLSNYIYHIQHLQTCTDNSFIG